jgi:hypothetical protein
VDNSARAAAWRATHPDLAQWIEETRSPFAASLKTNLERFGALTDSQCMAIMRDIAAKAAAAEIKAKAIAAAPHVNVKGLNTLESAFNAAIENGISRPKVIMDGIMIKRAPDTGRNQGALYVTEGSTYLGKIVNQAFVASLECDAEHKDTVLKLMENPLENMRAYGQRTGICCVCNRTLTNEDSIGQGIGPICASNFGF